MSDRIRVLLCDDVAAMRALLRAMLKAHDDIVVVGEAVDGQDGVDQARHLNPDVVLMDVSMPRKTGMEALMEIRSDLPGIAVVMLSSIAGEKLVRFARRAGAAAYLEKGVSEDVLVGAIRAASADAACS